MEWWSGKVSMCAGIADPADLSIHEAVELLRSGALSAVELTAANLARYDLTEPVFHAFAYLARDAAIKIGRASCRERVYGRV